jgi:hypothetical protein
MVRKERKLKVPLHITVEENILFEQEIKII